MSTLDRRSYRDAVARLSAAQKSGAGVPAYLRWVNRGLGRRAAAVAYLLRLTPNHVTLISIVLSIAGMVVLALVPPTPLSAIAATALLLAGYALDSADGQLARLTGTGSLAGEWLDHVVDAARLPLFHVAVAVFLIRQDVAPLLVAIPVAFALVSSVWFFAQTLAEKLASSASEAPAADSPAWVSFAKLPYDVGVTYLTVLLAWWTQPFLVVYGGLFAFTVCIAALSLVRKYRLLKEPARAAVG